MESWEDIWEWIPEASRQDLKADSMGTYGSKYLRGTESSKLGEWVADYNIINGKKEA